MWLKVFLISSMAIALSKAEAPLSRSAPYPAAGWRPKKPFHLPGKYLPPVEAELQQAPQPVSVEATKERVEFAGQIEGNSLVTTNQPHKTYAPPSKDNSNTDFLHTQELPFNKIPQFVEIAKPEKEEAPFFRDQFKQPPQPQYQFGERFPPSQFNFQDTRFPAQQYGAPNVDPRSFQQDDGAVNDEGMAVKALNSAADAYSRNKISSHSFSGTDEQDYAAQQQQENDSDYPFDSAVAPTRFTKGQYYILSPDNTLQRVMFTTSQDDQEYQNNGFTAQLKYTPIGEVRDPIFRYNNDGQLVRVFKK